MSIRWFLIAGVILWLVYEYASPGWSDILEQYATHIKFIGGVLVVIGLLCLPSVESVAMQHPSIYSLLRQYAADDGLNTQPTQSLRDDSVQGMQQRVSAGMQLAGADEKQAQSFVTPTPNVAEATTHAKATPQKTTINEWLTEHAPSLRMSVASGQGWKCKQCDGRLYADFCIQHHGAVCHACANAQQS